jgi:hypothetical protein
MDALESLVDFAALISYSTVHGNADNTERYDRQFGTVPESCVPESEQASPNVGVKQEEASNEASSQHCPSVQQDNAFAEIYQRSLPNPHAQTRGHRGLQRLRNDNEPLWSESTHAQMYSAHELRIHPGPSIDHQTLGDYRYMPPYTYALPYPLDDTATANAEMIYAYQPPYYYRNAEEERQIAMSREGLYGYSCADPRCDCRSYNVQTSYTNSGPGPIQASEAWRVYSAGFSGGLEGMRQRQASWGLDMEQTKMVQMQPY